MKPYVFGRYCLAVVCLLWFVPTAWAYPFVGVPAFEPAVPNTTQPITVSVISGGCGFNLSPEPGNPATIEYSPGIVDIFSPGYYNFIAICPPDPGHTAVFEIGALAAGNYQVRIWVVSDDGGCDGIVGGSPCLVSDAPLTVAGAAVAQPIPALGFGSALMLTFSILLVAGFVLHKRHRAWFGNF